MKKKIGTILTGVLCMLLTAAAVRMPGAAFPAAWAEPVVGDQEIIDCIV
ncbi:MAG: hypothetical protein K5746_09420 [Clostridiales bacterium]|nr:hypothetical protein [Clostridiales bacterium]